MSTAPQASGPDLDAINAANELFAKTLQETESTCGG